MNMKVEPFRSDLFPNNHGKIATGLIVVSATGEQQPYSLLGIREVRVSEDNPNIAYRVRYQGPPARLGEQDVTYIRVYFKIRDCNIKIYHPGKDRVPFLRVPSGGQIEFIEVS